ncbi:protein kinase domain-containing protein [Sorangium sp. So ce693]|uniref:serine/threonine-protein kinase n=1 Tax=Sorangium sp. So ce693 TaxID=3133318 RepID=UPI003F60297B
MAREALKAGDVFLDYRITEVIDAGGMGEVYRAVEDYSEDVVAIKCMLPRHLKREDFARRFRQECKFYPKLKHPNIVRMRKAGVSPDHVAYIVMDYLEGRTLRKLLNKAYRLDFLSAMHVMLQVADAMTFVHSKGIWHRDLKPENIMVGTKADAKGHVWLLDFGIAKFADGGMNTDDLPDVGTVRYISPEQVKMLYTSSRKAERVERARPDGRTDIYAFGAIFYEVLTGKHLFLDDSEPATAEETLTGHLVAAPEPVHEIVPDCPEFLWPVVARCIAIDREERYPRFDDVARDLRGLLRDTVPAGHVLAQRLARERMEAERQAAFAGVALEDSTPVEDETSAAGRAGEEETEEARQEGEMERGSAEGEKRARRVVHGETAPLEQFVAPASALPFAPASRVPRGRGVGHTEPLPALKLLESTAKLGGTWAERMAQRTGPPAMPQAGAQGVGGPLPPAEVRAQAYAGPPPQAQAYGGPASHAGAQGHGGPPPLPQSYGGPPPLPQSYGGPPQSYGGPPQSHGGPPPLLQSYGGPASHAGVQGHGGPPPLPQSHGGPPLQSHGGPPLQSHGGPPPLPQSYGGPPPLPQSYGGPAPHAGAQGHGGPAPLPVIETQHATSWRDAQRAAPQPPQEVELPYVTPQLSAMESPRSGAPLPIVARPVAPSSVTAPSVVPAESLRKETPMTAAPAALLTQRRRAPRAYVLAPLVALALTLGGVGVVLALRSARGTAPAPVTGEPAPSAAPASAASVESATASAATASAATAAVAPAPPPEASPAAPAPEATASAAAASTAEAAVEAGAAEKAGAAAAAEAPAPKEQPAAAKEQAAVKEQAAAKAAPVKAAPAATDDDEDFYPMPKRQKPSFLRVIEERKKAAPAKVAAPAQAGGTTPAKPCPAVGCRPF